VEIEDALDATIPARLRGPLTRSSIKPRLLFPSAEQTAAKDKKTRSQLQIPSDDDEEAVTDIEDQSHEVSTPIDDEMAVTPNAPRFAPYSPPSTARATRSKKVDDGGSSPLVPSFDGSFESGSATSRRRTSPFAGWARTKTSVSGPSKKREGDALANGEGGKRARGGRF
jgi:hypothetical protein